MKLYGLHFSPRFDLKAFVKSVDVTEVRNVGKISCIL